MIGGRRSSDGQKDTKTEELLSPGASSPSYTLMADANLALDGWAPGISCHSMRNQLLRPMFLTSNRCGSTCRVGQGSYQRIQRFRQSVRLEALESKPLPLLMR